MALKRRRGDRSRPHGRLGSLRDTRRREARCTRTTAARFCSSRERSADAGRRRGVGRRRSASTRSKRIAAERNSTRRHCAPSGRLRAARRGQRRRRSSSTRIAFRSRGPVAPLSRTTRGGATRLRRGRCATAATARPTFHRPMMMMSYTARWCWYTAPMRPLTPALPTCPTVLMPR